jgi:hypothetical protein
VLTKKFEHSRTPWLVNNNNKSESWREEWIFFTNKAPFISLTQPSFVFVQTNRQPPDTAPPPSSKEEKKDEKVALTNTDLREQIGLGRWSRNVSPTKGLIARWLKNKHFWANFCRLLILAKLASLDPSYHLWQRKENVIQISIFSPPSPLHLHTCELVFDSTSRLVD